MEHTDSLCHDGAVLDSDALFSLSEVAARRTPAGDPAHDFEHVQRVARTAEALAKEEGANVGVTVAAALLHEVFHYPKDHPESHRSGEVAAQHAGQILRAEGIPEALCEAIAYCIRVHPFSLRIEPETLEAKILQDADRLDALGSIGIARTFATAGSLARPLYHPEDPFCETRVPDDKLWTLDHFYLKLLRLPERMWTASAKTLADRRVQGMRAFLSELRVEVGSPR